MRCYRDEDAYHLDPTSIYFVHCCAAATGSARRWLEDQGGAEAVASGILDALTLHPLPWWFRVLTWLFGGK